ncbi:SagB/ThcOx family dehydrogenase [bacterium]|nr:SagB/ThcOx family dehydrogenase [bacterium]
MKKNIVNVYRDFLKDRVRKEIDFSQTDQCRGIKEPPIQKEYSFEQKIIKLPEKEEWNSVKDTSIRSAIQSRQSHRNYKDKPLKLDELAFLLWSTQGIRKKTDSGRVLRTVPSAGNRHSFETYLLIFNVSGLEQGIYRYLPLENSIVLEDNAENLSNCITNSSLGQSFLAKSAVVFVWTVIPYRMEWRYDIAAHRVIAMDVGHVCQNLYLACEAIDSGTCGVAAFDQDSMDNLVSVDGSDEFVIYMAPVGKVT